MREERFGGVLAAAQLRKCILHYLEVPKCCRLHASFWFCCHPANTYYPRHEEMAYLGPKGRLECVIHTEVKELIISTDTQNSGKCNNHQLQVAPGDQALCNGQIQCAQLKCEEIHLR